MVKQLISGVPNIYVYTLLIVAILGGGYLIFGPVLGIGQFSIGAGATVLNLNQVSLVSASGLSTGTVWQANLAYIGTSNSSLIGTTYSTSNTQLQTTDGKKSKDAIKVDSSVTKLTCNYPTSLAQPSNAQRYYVSLQPTPVTVKSGTTLVDIACTAALLNGQHTYSEGILTTDYCADSYKRTCDSIPNAKWFTSKDPVLFGGINLGSLDKYICGSYQKDTSHGTYSVLQPTSFNPDVNVHYTITNIGTGAVENLDLNPANPIAKSSETPPKVNIQLTGGLTSFDTQCPEYSSWYLLQYTGITSNSILIVPRSLVEGNTLPVLKDGDIIGNAIIAVNIYNNNLDNYGQSPNNYLNNANANNYQFTGLTFNNAAISIDRKGRPFIYPTVMIQMSTDFVGIYTPQAKPSIVNIIPEKVTLSQNGEQGKVDIYVNNNGDSGSAILTTVQCSPNGLTIQGGIAQPVSSSTPGDFTFYMGGNKGTYTCTAKACDSPQLEHCVQSNFGVDVKAQCNAGTKPGDNYGLVYNPDGSCNWSCQITSCPAKYHFSKCDCVADPPEPCTPQTNLLSCQTWDSTNCIVKIQNGYKISDDKCIQDGKCTADETCSNGVITKICDLSTGILTPTGKSCNDNTCTYPSVESTTTQNSPFAGIPLIGGLFTPTVTKTCVLDPNLTLIIIIAIIGILAIVLISMFSKKGKGKTSKRKY